MKVDKEYCMSSFLMYRTIADENLTFANGIKPNIYQYQERFPIYNSEQLEKYLKQRVGEVTKNGKAALALSGGIDSAILAKFMPEGSTAYTFRCVVPGVAVKDESKKAAKIAKECGLKHKIVEITWQDMERYASELMLSKGAPIHSIEIQIYKAALQAKTDGFEKLIFGESADCIYGGLNQLLSKDWLFGEFIDRYSFVIPWKVLKKPKLILEPYMEYEKNGYVDVHKFMYNFFFRESVGSYDNACNLAGIDFVAPYAETVFSKELDYDRVRNGENKYVVREIFKRLYATEQIPEKLPMPRPVNEWLKDWKGPTREEFLENCVIGLNGDQKWLVYILEKFLNLINEKGDN